MIKKREYLNCPQWYTGLGSSNRAELSRRSLMVGVPNPKEGDESHPPGAPKRTAGLCAQRLLQGSGEVPAAGATRKEMRQGHLDRLDPEEEFRPHRLQYIR